MSFLINPYRFAVAAGGGVPVLESYSSFASTVEQTDIVLSKPSGVVSGNFLVMLVGNEDQTSTAQFSAHTGWTQGSSVGSPTSDVHGSWYWRVANGSEASTETVVAQSADYCAGFYLRFSGAASAVEGSSVQRSNAFTHIANSFTTTINNTLAIAFCSFDGADTADLETSGTGWPSGTITAGQYVETGGVNNGLGFGFVTKTVATAGASEDCTFTASVSDGATLFQIGIQP